MTSTDKAILKQYKDNHRLVVRRIWSGAYDITLSDGRRRHISLVASEWVVKTGHVMDDDEGKCVWCGSYPTLADAELGVVQH